MRRGHTSREGGRAAAFVVALMSALVAAALALPGAAAHEPITTKIMFNKEVVRILQRNCLACHHPGGIAPWSLVTYQEARPWAKAIKEELLEKRMPPWHAVKGFGEFSNAPSLTRREIDLIVNWVEGGAPPGKPDDLPPGPIVSSGWALGEPDLILAPDSPIQVPPDADTRVRIEMPGDPKEERWLKAIDLLPGDGTVAHCATYYLAEATAAEVEGSRRTGDSASPPVTGDAPLGTWVPGTPAVPLPDGTARRVPAGSRLIVELHYKGNGGTASDRPSVGLYFAKERPGKWLRELSIPVPDAVIPAGSRGFKVEASLVIEEASELAAILPRVDPLLISLEATAYRPDGAREVLIWSRGYRFDWQPTYHFKRPVPLPRGSRVKVTAYFDNSGENRFNPANPAKEVRLSGALREALCVLMIASAPRGGDVALRR